MNLALWIAQWGLAAFCVFFAVFRIVDALKTYRHPSVRTGQPLFSRGEGLCIGLVYLASALLLLFEYHGSWVFAALFVAEAVLRGWPYPFYA